MTKAHFETLVRSTGFSRKAAEFRLKAVLQTSDTCFAATFNFKSPERSKCVLNKARFANQLGHSLRVALAVLSLAIAGSTSAEAQQPTIKNSDSKSDWKIKWSASDEFNGDEVDWNKWIPEGNLPDTHSWLWRNKSNVVAQDGVARISVRHNADNAKVKGTYFTSGILKSYKTFKYGYFEARLRAASFPGSGVCSSFWLFSDFDDSVADGETIYSEVDVVELQQFDWLEGKQDDARDMDLNLHCVTKEADKRKWRRPKAFPESQLNKWRAPWDPRDDFHIYGCEVNEKEIIWYVDGEEVARKPNTYWHRPKHLALSLGLRSPFVQFEANRNNASDPLENAEARKKIPELPTSMVVDYVRVWQKAE